MTKDSTAGSERPINNGLRGTCWHKASESDSVVHEDALCLGFVDGIHLSSLLRNGGIPMDVKTEADLVQDGFELQFAMAYKTFMDAYLSAKDPADQKAAVSKLQAGVTSARAVRDVAKSNLPAAES